MVLKGTQRQGLELNGYEVERTAGILVQRIQERFPNSGLASVCRTIHIQCRETESEIAELKRPYWSLRSAAIGLLIFSLLLLMYLMLGGVNWSRFGLPASYTEFIGVLEPSLGSLVFLTAYIVFISSLESRWKQRRILKSLNSLRGLAHVIDMHQLTKAPERLLLVGPDTASSPERTLSPFMLGRYLDYSSEMLSLLSKVAALWAQAFPEPRVLTAVDEIEMLTSGLSRKIWQKMMVLESVVTESRQAAPKEE